MFACDSGLLAVVCPSVSGSDGAPVGHMWSQMLLALCASGL